MGGLDAAFDTYGLAAVSVVMLAKAAGVPVPIPGDLILLATAARAAEGKFELWQAFVALLVAVVLGGAMQFAAARGPGRGLVYRIARVAGLSPQRLDAAARRLQRRGLLSIAVALFTPGVRNAAVPACGLAGMSFSLFLPALALASGLDLALHFAIGAAGGTLVAALSLNAVVIVVTLVILAVAGLAAWRLIAHGRNVFGAWQATACPACLVLGALASQANQILVPAPEEATGVHV